MKLAERRKQRLQHEIAAEALQLFTEKGVASTSVADITEAAGVSQRTFWRYFRSKESCVQPLLLAGIKGFAAQLRAWSPGTPLATALDDTERVPTELMLTALRLLTSEPGIREAWLMALYEAWAEIAEIFAEHSGRSADGYAVQVWAGMANSAMFVGLLRYANTTSRYDPQEVLAVLQRALDTASAGIPAGQWPV